MPQHSTRSDVPWRDAYERVRVHAGLIHRGDRGRILVSGRDRATYLQGLLTNDVVALGAGTGCYAAYLTAQGRMITDLWVYELGDVMLLTMGLDVKDAVLAKLDQFIFGEDVQLGDVTETFAGIAVVGPEAVEVIAGRLPGVTHADLTSLPEHGNVRTAFEGQPAIVLRVTDTGEPGFEMLVPIALRERLSATLSAHGVPEVPLEAAEALRIEAGIPKFHQDMDEETIPLEAGIEGRAISLTKGCYVGQEVIVRVLHRGHGRVARRLVGLLSGGDQALSPGAKIQAGGREIGRVTSAVVSPRAGRSLALGYVQRDFAAERTLVDIEGTRATVSALPFPMAKERAGESEGRPPLD